MASTNHCAAKISRASQQPDIPPKKSNKTKVDQEEEQHQHILRASIAGDIRRKISVASARGAAVSAMKTQSVGLYESSLSSSHVSS
jgi:DNA polymerase/3'-5' exonuclease PolX